MNRLPRFDLASHTDLATLDFGAMRMALRHEAAEHDLRVGTDTDARIEIAMPTGTIGVVPRDTGVRLSVTAARADWLFMLKENVVEHIGHFVPDAVRDLRWNDHGDETSGALPANFRFATVQSVEPVGAVFCRVRVQASGLESFDSNAIHFRLALPPVGLEQPEWPCVAANGTTIWPRGPAALHLPVYTTRAINVREGVMDFDVFQHAGGRVTQWVQNLTPGTQVAVMGPGGGGMPTTDRIALYGDETAFPAIARILENLPRDAVGRAVLLSEAGAECGYPMTPPLGIEMIWQRRSTPNDLVEIALCDHAAHPERFVWFAGEKAATQKVRRSLGKPVKGNSYIASYWSELNIDE